MPLSAAASARAPESRTERALGGWFWMSSGAVVQGLVTVAVLAILARLLSPTDFGSVSAGLLVINFALILSQGLVGPALVQHPNLRVEHIRTGYAMSVYGGAVLFVLVWLAAPVAAAVLHVAALTTILRVLAAILPIQGLGAVAEALLRRDLQYGSVASIRMMSYTLGYGAVGVTMAVAGGGLWSLVAANAAQVSLNTVLLLRRKPHDKQLRIYGVEFRELFSFAGGFSLGRIGNYAAVNGDYLVVVKWLGAAALGIYERAYQLMAMPAVLVGQVLDDVLFPAMAQIQTERARVAGAYRRCAAGVALFALPLTALFLILAPEIVYVLLGPRWGQVTAPLRVLAIGLLFRTSYKISDSLTRALGAVYRRAWRQWTYAAFVIGGGIVGQRWGLTGVAAAVLLALFVNFLLTAHLGTALVSMTWREYLRAHVPGVRASVLVGVPAFLLATLARAAFGGSPVVVLAVTLAGTVLVVAPLLYRNAGRLLGPDGLWLWQKVSAFCASKVPGLAPALGGAPGNVPRP